MVYSRHDHTEHPSYHPVVIKDEQRFWKRILIVDNDEDIAITFKAGIEGCFIRKPVTIDYLIERIMSELD
jgi:hypothetical protein